MKIALAVHHFPPRYTAGAEGYAYRVASAMHARGHSVHVLCVERVDSGPADGAIAADDVYDGLPVRRLSFNFAAVPDRIRWEYNNPWLGAQVQAWLGDIQPDIFHLVSGYLLSGSALHAGRQAAVPMAVTLTDFWFLCPRITLLRSDGQVSDLPIDPATCARCLGEERRRYRWLGQLWPGAMAAFWRLRRARVRQIESRAQYLQEALNLADALISPSQFLRAFFGQAGIDPARIKFIRHGRDFPHLTPELLKKTPVDHLRVGYLGQITWHKGVHVLWEALARLPEAPITVRAYGDAEAFPAYAAQLRAHTARDARAQLVGAYQGALGLTHALRELDVVVVPSLWYENCPYVILEALAHRTPVIASNWGGMAELVQHEHNGLLFAPGDANDLARQLRRLLDEPDLLPRLHAQIAPIKSVTQEMDELEQLYQQVVQEAHAPRY